MAFDPGRGKTVLFGGSSGAAYGDTWEWDGTAWRGLITPGPTFAAGLSGALAYDVVRQRTVLVGSGQTWEFVVQSCWYLALELERPQIVTGRRDTN
jgi:hypothetical protein